MFANAFQSAAASVFASPTPQGNVIADSRAYQFNWVVSNPYDTASSFQFLLTAEAYAREFSPSASPVPELPAGALFAMGLACLAQRQVRRRRDTA